VRTVYTMTAIPTGTHERLAKAIHDAYLQQAIERGDSADTHDSVRPWDELPQYLKDFNREQAGDIGRKLAMVGLRAVPMNGSSSSFTFTEEEVEELARAEHLRWMKERLDKGWSLGPVRDSHRKLHPDLVDWEYLSEDSRDKDRSAVRTIPRHLELAGLRVVPMR
jgi:RyR domain